MTQVESISPPSKPQRYLVLSATPGEMQQEINKQAGNGYKPILMCGMGGGTIIVILEHTAS